MIDVLTRQAMRDFDHCAIESGVPGIVLMENAGRGAADIIARLLGAKGTGARAGSVVVVAGGGNNGGDGFVVARHLVTRGIVVRVALVEAPERLTGDALTNYRAFLGIGGTVMTILPGADRGALPYVLDAADLIVDAVFGTGLNRPVTGHLAFVIEAMNQARARKVSLDIPSGLDADRGTPLGCAVRADHTITFALPKIGLLLPEGVRHTGTLHCVDIGVPSKRNANISPVAEILESRDVASWLVPRPADTHKHRAGSVLVLAGSPGKVGAALLAGHGALRAGAGLVTIASFPEAMEAIEPRVTELMTLRLDRRQLRACLSSRLASCRAVVVGPGFGFDGLSRIAIDHVVFGHRGTVIVDADALTAFVGRESELALAPGHLVLTPHAGEASRLLRCCSKDVEADRIGAVRALANATKAVVLLKGAHTLIATPDGATPGRIALNRSGNPAMATAGAGDVLAGIAAAFACTLQPWEAACAAAHVHGLAGDSFSQRAGGADRGLLAGELGDEIPRVLAVLATEHASLSL